MVLGGAIMLVFSILNIIGTLLHEKRTIIDEAERLSAGDPRKKGEKQA